jgi:purine-nucleoside phosphorylase
MNEEGIVLKDIDRAARFVKDACGGAEMGIILGSGLGAYTRALKGSRSIPYSAIPGFPKVTVPGHVGMWHGGLLHGKRVCMMQGRFHAYEGYDLAAVTFPVRVMALLGVKTLFITNAAGGVNLDFQAGDLMQISDFINFSGLNPLSGPNLDIFGPRFLDMSYAYDRELAAIVHRKAAELNIQLQKGVYGWLRGPSFETPAEIRMIRALGVDAVGMSTVPETIVARHCGMKVLGLSCITNMAAGILDMPLSHEEVMATGEQAKGIIGILLDAVIRDI